LSETSQNETTDTNASFWRSRRKFVAVTLKLLELARANNKTCVSIRPLNG
jgi:hypothetical protein